MSDNIQDDFQRIRTQLSAFYKPHEIDIWLRTPHPLLDNRRACDLINEGRPEAVERVIVAVDAGVYL